MLVNTMWFLALRDDSGVLTVLTSLLASAVHGAWPGLLACKLLPRLWHAAILFGAVFGIWALILLVLPPSLFVLGIVVVVLMECGEEEESFCFFLKVAQGVVSFWASPKSFLGALLLVGVASLSLLVTVNVVVAAPFARFEYRVFAWLFGQQLLLASLLGFAIYRAAVHKIESL